MMGADIERMVSGIDAVMNATITGITSLSSATAYQMISRETHGGLSTAPCRPEEIEVPDGDPMSAVSSAMGAMSSDCGKMDSIGEGNFKAQNQFNNSIGSPWSELTKLQDAVSAASSYSGAHAPFNYVGEKAGMLAMMNMVLSMAINAKFALIIYHDYVQRGFDTKFNGNKPSITFQHTIDTETNGNITQEYGENVKVETPSVDPF